MKDQIWNAGLTTVNTGERDKELAEMQAKAEQAWEADKLAKRNARPETAVHSVPMALQNRKATLVKSQAKITELEAAAKAAVEAVDEAKQKADKLQGEIDKLQTEYDEEVARLVKPSDLVTHLRNSVREAFQALSGSVEAQPLISQLETAFTGLSSLLAAATPTPMRATTSICSRTRTGPFQPKRWPGPRSARWKAFPWRSERPRSRGSWSTSSKRGEFSHLKRRLYTTYCACSLQAASGKGPSLESLAKILVGEGLPVRESHQKHPGQIPRQTSLRGNLDR